MIPLLTAAQMRRMDDHTIHRVGVPGVVLMETAGRGVFEQLWAEFQTVVAVGPVAVVCGRGNNGGDGFVVARCLHNRGVAVTVYLLGSRNAVVSGGEARVHLDAFVNGGGRLVELGADEPRVGEEIAAATLVVDAVLGTGLKEDLRGLPATAVGWINAAPGPVVSVDIPSGVCSDSGRLCGAAVAADLTVTFAFPKRGHYLYPGASHTGALRVVDIGIPGDILDHVPADLFLLTPTGAAPLPARLGNGHKGSFGHVVVLGGSTGKAGAPGLAAWAALRSGAGLATVAWPRGIGGDERLPLEVMTLPLEGAGDGSGQWCAADWAAVRELAAAAKALVVGPGMGAGSGAAAVLRGVLGESGAPAVVDADALTLLAAVPSAAADARRELVLTPHPGEAARLLGADSVVVQNDRVAAVEELAGRFRCAVVLKGAGTLVAAPGVPTCLLPVGNPGMATAGSGDVLAGVVAALLARGLAPVEAAQLGVLVHGKAGDGAAQRLGEESMIAGDIVEALPASFLTLTALP